MKTHSSTTRGNGDKRERILAAAERIFAERGFFHARVAEIARAAGVADGTIYLYFKSKDDILISLFETRMEQVNDALQRAADGVPDPTEKLRAIVRAYLGLIAAQPNVAEVLVIELRQSSKFMKEYTNPRFAELLKLLAGAVADGQAAGVFDTRVPAPHAARMIFGILDELALAWLLGRGEKFDIVRAAEWVDALILGGLMVRAEQSHTQVQSVS